MQRVLASYFHLFVQSKPMLVWEVGGKLTESNVFDTKNRHTQSLKFMIFSVFNLRLRCAQISKKILFG